MILVRAQDGGVHVVENVCAHRGMASAASAGNRKDFTCPNHQWNYSLKGDLQGVPFRRGVKQDGKVQGGMPVDFKPADNGLTKLRVATRGGVVFASFDPDVESLEAFLGPTILRLLRSPLRRPRPHPARLQPPAHPGELEADDRAASSASMPGMRWR